MIGQHGYTLHRPNFDEHKNSLSFTSAGQNVIMKMATGIELCEEQGDILADDNNQELDPNVVEERFRVDRRKLEQMLQGQSGLRRDLQPTSFVLFVFCLAKKSKSYELILCLRLV